MACRSSALIWGVLGRTVAERCGSEGIAETFFRRIAHLQATRAFESGPFERNARGMAAYVRAAKQTLGVEVEEGGTSEHAILRRKRCSLYDDPAKGSTLELCQAYAAFGIEAARICRPLLHCSVTRSLGRGAIAARWCSRWSADAARPWG